MQSPDDMMLKTSKKKVPVPKSISQSFYEKYSPIINKASKELGSRKLGGYAGLLRARRDDPNLYNRIVEITDKEIAMEKKEQEERNAKKSAPMNLEGRPKTTVTKKYGGKIAKRKATKSVSGHNRLY